MDDNQKKCSDIVPARVIFAVLGCVGFMIVYGLKVNLSVAIIAMVNHTAVAEMSSHHHDDHHDDHHDNMTLVVADDMGENVTLDDCGVKIGGGKAMEDGPFAWDENIQGLILASYFYGYFFTQVPGGWVAEKFSAKHVFGVGALINAICALISPIAAKGSYVWLVVIRIIMGIAGGRDSTRNARAGRQVGAPAGEEQDILCSLCRNDARHPRLHAVLWVSGGRYRLVCCVLHSRRSFTPMVHLVAHLRV